MMKRRHDPNRIRSLPVAICLVVCLLTAGLLAGCGGGADEQAAPQPRPALVPEGVAARDSVATEAAAVDSAATPVTGEQAAPAANRPVVRPAEAPAKSLAETASPPATSVAGGDFALQLGSFRKAENARALAEKIRQLGHDTMIRPVTTDGATHHRVLVPGLPDRQQARHLGDTLSRQLGVDYLIVNNK